MGTRVLTVGFGEPSTPDPNVVQEYLEGIFLRNMSIEGDMPEATARERAETLASRRMPGLVAEYEAIGGSPLQAQLEAYTGRLDDELGRRGYDVTTTMATQYHSPTIGEVVATAATDGIDHLVILPMYPLCGPSTTVAAIADVAQRVETIDDWTPTLSPIGGWHRHQRYNRLRAEHTKSVLDDRGIDLGDPTVELLFSAHGTPVHYLEQGSRYDRYVEEYCEVQSSMLGIDTYSLGFQNHESRGVEWTTPSIETAIEHIEADHVVVEAISFIHEQSETLSELDEELAEEAAELDLAFDRVPIPHDHPAMASVLADLVEPAIAGFDGTYVGFRDCQCVNTAGARCLCGSIAR